jgi:hypothetical protein
MLPGVVGRGVDTQSLFIATAIVVVVLILGGLALTHCSSMLTHCSLCDESIRGVVPYVLDRACVPEAPEQATRRLGRRATLAALGPPQSPDRRCPSSSVCNPSIGFGSLVCSHISLIWGFDHCCRHPGRRPPRQHKAPQREPCERLCERPRALVSGCIWQVVAWRSFTIGKSRRRSFYCWPTRHTIAR